MKKLLITLLLSICASAIYAQDTYMEIVRSTIKTEKKALIAEVMKFKDEESRAFWPLYNEYDEKLYKINTDYFNLINDFADNFENMTAEKATEIMTKATKISLDKAKLEQKYVKKMIKVISPQKTLRFFQASGKIETMIEAQLATEIPLLEKIE